VDSDTQAQLDRLIAAAGSSTRRTILFALLADRRAYTIDQAAEIAAVHRTVAFGHLERLADLGLLLRSRRRGRRGKPALLYSAVDGGLAVSVPQRQFERLATLLAAGLSGFAQPGRTAARLAGRRYGESLKTDRPASVAIALGPLQTLGGAYEVEGQRIVARNCIFREACHVDPALVCGLQAGIIEGVLHSAGIAAHVEPTGPTQSGGCAYYVKAA
jgi:predicted ArsR family transcriptional regulator